MKWYIKQVVCAHDVKEFLNSVPKGVALTAKVTFDRNNENDYCSTFYTIFYYSDREY
jgi:hypothetical protein